MADVLDFNSKKLQKERTGLAELPPEVVKQLDIAEGHVKALTEQIEAVLVTYAESQEGLLKITVPLDALARATAYLALELDRQIPPEQQPMHQKLREDLISIQVNVVDQFCRSQAQAGIPVLSHDIYLGLMNTMIEFVNRFRAAEETQLHFAEENPDHAYDFSDAENTTSGSEPTSH